MHINVFAFQWKGTERVEGIVLVSFSREKQLLSLDAQAFSRMERLRYLQIIYDVQLLQGLAYLSNELRYMDWHDYPLKSFPSTFQPKSLLEIHLPHSKIEHLFDGIMVSFLNDSLNELQKSELTALCFTLF